MAEISEALPESTAETSEEQHEPDPKTIRKTEPGLKRLLLTISVLVSFILGFPFLWKSVEIYRSPLPFRDIDSLFAQLQSDPLLFPLSFQVVLIGFDSQHPHNLISSIQSEIEQLNLADRNNLSVSVTIDSGSGNCLRNSNNTLPSSSSSCLYQCGSITAVDFDLSDDDEAIDELLQSRFGACSGGRNKVYSLVVINGGNERAVAGKYRHAWVVLDGGERKPVASRVAQVLVKVFVNGGREEGSIGNEYIPVGADGRIVLSFNLLNADPEAWVYDWDFRTIDETLLAPMIEALGPIADISVESQVLYHTPKASFSHWDQKLESYVFSTKDLPFFVNSNEWHLDTSIAAGGRSKILHFVVYIPSARECPLVLRLPNGEISKTNGFISPMWGGIIVWNPQSCLKDSKIGLTSKHTIPIQDLHNMFEVFMGQFRQLFGLKSGNHYSGATGMWNFLPGEKGFTEWEMDILLRRHTSFNLHSCATTLGSLSRLVQSLPRMIIKDEIGKQVMLSLEAAKLAQSNASLGVYESSAASSRLARSRAEDAFFHPSIMSVSYYSFEHCFAVYSPFFLPVSMHVVLAAVRELKRYRQENTKYRAWKKIKAA